MVHLIFFPPPSPITAEQGLGPLIEATGAPYPQAPEYQAVGFDKAGMSLSILFFLFLFLLFFLFLQKIFLLVLVQKDPFMVLLLIMK